MELSSHVQDLLKLLAVQKTAIARLGREPTMEEWAEEAGAHDHEAFEARVKLGMAARERMVHANQRLVVSVAK